MSEQDEDPRAAVLRRLFVIGCAIDEDLPERLEDGQTYPVPGALLAVLREATAVAGELIGVPAK